MAASTMGMTTGHGLRAALLALIAATPECASAQVQAPQAPSRASVEPVAIRSGDTDPELADPDRKHFVFADDDILVRHDPGRPADRGELLLWLPGTQPPGASSDGPGGAVEFARLAARLGYRVIVLKYPNDESASVCRRDSSPTAFEEFRLALIEGGSTPHVTVSRADSIENRLIKLLRWLARERAGERWDQFLDGDDIRWERIAVAGQSQGGGHAALIGIEHRVARVICTGAPKDHSLALGKPAAWLTKDSATPKSRFFAFNHLQDHQGCSPTQQWENLQALGLDALGPQVDVDQASPPYDNSRCLVTNYPGTEVDSSAAHTSVISPRNAEVFGPVWRYMLTAPVE